jgi:hypothetical protein
MTRIGTLIDERIQHSFTLPVKLHDILNELLHFIKESVMVSFF